jgi:hypothetical protein
MSRPTPRGPQIRHQIEELDLSWNALGLHGVKEVCDALSTGLGSLRWLDLSWNALK